MIKEIKSLWARRHWHKLDIPLHIIVQGPLHPESCSNLRAYTKWGKVYVSYWKENWSEPLQYPGVEFLANESPQMPGCNISNIKNQVFSTCGALDRIGWEGFIIKLRSDESYRDLSPLINGMLRHPDKLTTSNIFFQADKPYHFSDHVIAGTTRNVRKMLDITKGILYNNTMGVSGESIGLHRYPGGLRPEQILCTAFMMSKGVQLSLDTWKTHMRDHVNLVNVKELGDYRVRANCFNKTYAPGEVIPDSLESMENL
jgi:hypothetical protein